MSAARAAPAAGTSAAAAAHVPGDATAVRARPAHDLRLAAPAGAAWVGAAGGLALPGRVVAVLVGLLGTFVLALAAVARVQALRARQAGLCWTLLVAAGVGASALVIAGLRAQALQAGPLPELTRAKATVTATGVVTGDPRAAVGAPRFGRPGAAYEVVPLRLERLSARGSTWAVRVPVRVTATGAGWGDLVPSQRVALSARMATPLPGQPVAASLVATGRPRLLGRPSAVQRVAGHLRSRLRRAVAGLPSGPRGLLPGLVDGDTSLLPDDLAAEVKVAGLTHLSAVSGANVAIVVGAALLLARWAGVRGRGLPVVGAVALAAFVVLARPQASVLRAGAMGCVGLLGLARGRPASALPALGAAVTGLLLLDPWQARSYGFALSALATGALLLGAPPLVRALTGHGVPLRLAQALAVPVAAHLATAPVIALLSGSLSLVAVPANLVAEPFVAPATVLGVLVALVAAVSTPAGALLAHVAAVPAAVVVADAHASARLPAAVVPWPATLRGALVLAALAAVLPWSVRRFVRHRGVRIGALAAALALVAANLVAPRWPPPGWVFVVCDVGQGDALVLHAGPGTAVVVDAGPDPAPVDRCLRDLHVTRVDELVLTHFHADHVEGLPGVLHGRTVRELRTSPLREPPAEAARVDGWTRTRGIPSRPLTDGETGSDGSLRWQVLAPEAVRAGEDPNEASIVLLVEVAGLRLLLTGDVTPVAQQALHVGAPPLDRPVDVLKVPHHGSPHQDPVFLTAVHARLALVSVGVNNDYGHPSPETLALLSRAGALVARTDRQGDLAVLPGPSGPVLVPRHSAG